MTYTKISIQIKQKAEFFEKILIRIRTIHQLSELERTQILQSLALAVRKAVLALTLYRIFIIRKHLQLDQNLRKLAETAGFSDIYAQD